MRERPNDLRSLIAAEVVWTCHRQGKAITGLDRTAMDRLLVHPWPGNLRELNRVIRAAVALTDGDAIPAEATLLEEIAAVPLSAGPTPNGATPPAPAAPAEDLTLEAAERRHIRRVLDLVSGNKRRAARALGVSRSTLDRKLSS